MKWAYSVFEELYDAPSRNGIYKTKEFHGSGAKIVNMGELFGLDFISSQEMKRVQLTNAELERSCLHDGDLLFGRRSLVEEGAGKCSVVRSPSEPTTFESSIIRVRLDKERCNPLFYYYWFKSSAGRAAIRAIVSGTNVKGIKGSDLKNIKVASPPKATQDQIAEIFYAYDDLIENNRRRIQLLEESARLLYQEWFVHLRFPGHEHVKVVDGVPEGWFLTKIGNLSSVKSGYAFKSRDWLTEGNPVIKIKNITDNYQVDTTSCQCISDNIGEKASKFRLSANNLLIAMTGATIGKFALMPRTSRQFFLNQRVGLFSPLAEDYTYYLFCALGSTPVQSTINNLAAGAAQPNISGKQIESIPILAPNSQLMDTFLSSVSPMFEQRQSLIEMNQKLTQARDLLLPRLMNGELL